MPIPPAYLYPSMPIPQHAYTPACLYPSMLAPCTYHPCMTPGLGAQAQGRGENKLCKLVPIPFFQVQTPLPPPPTRHTCVSMRASSKTNVACCEFNLQESVSESSTRPCHKPTVHTMARPPCPQASSSQPCLSTDAHIQRKIWSTEGVVCPLNRSAAVGRVRFSHYLGVSWDRQAQVWQARAHKPDGTAHCIGDYPEEEAAARTYDEYALQHHGNGAVRNFPPSTYTGEASAFRQTQQVASLDSNEVVSLLLCLLLRRCSITICSIFVWTLFQNSLIASASPILIRSRVKSVTVLVLLMHLTTYHKAPPYQKNMTNTSPAARDYCG